MKAIFLIVLLVVIGYLPLDVAGQRINTAYWTRTVIATQSDCKIRVAESALSPGEKECEFVGLLQPGSKLIIKKFVNSRPWAKVTFKDGEGETFQIEVDNRSIAIFGRIFSRLFSERENTEHPLTCNGKVKDDFLVSVGFPNRFIRSGQNETWRLGLDHPAVTYCGFDIAEINFTRRKLVGIGGII